MAIRFGEIKEYLARNVRLSVHKKDDHYDDYLMVSDIPECKYDDYFVYGVGMIDVEFSQDEYAEPEGMDFIMKDMDLKPAIEIVIQKEPREIERKEEGCLKYRDLKPYLQTGRNFTVYKRENWNKEEYEYKSDIPEKYDDKYVYGIGMENNYSEDDVVDRIEIKHDTVSKKRMVIVLSDTPRSDISYDSRSKCKGPFFLVVTADKWCHDADEWLGIYTNRKEAREAYDRAVVWWEEENKTSRYNTPQEVTLFEYILKDDCFRKVSREELED